MMLPALLLLTSLSGIGLRGSTTCPTVQQVDAELSGLLPTNDGELRWVELVSQPNALQLRLWSAGRQLETVRSIPLPASCEALAKASAVAIALWVAETNDTPVAPPVAERMFDRTALERMRVFSVSPAPEPKPVRGPFITMALGTIASVAGLSLGLTSVNDRDRMIAASAAYVGGLAVSHLGFYWLMVLIGLKTEGPSLTF